MSFPGVVHHICQLSLRQGTKIDPAHLMGEKVIVVIQENTDRGERGDKKGATKELKRIKKMALDGEPPGSYRWMTHLKLPGGPWLQEVNVSCHPR